MMTARHDPNTTPYTCAWRGCTATGLGWSVLFGPKEGGWCFAGNIPPDDTDGPLCPIHAAAFNEWAYFLCDGDADEAVRPEGAAPRVVQ